MRSYSTDGPVRHIVVVEDEAPIRLSLSLILEESGYRVTAATNGREGYDAIRGGLGKGESVDLLITDLEMDHMTGQELVAALRRDNIDIPILVVTGHGDKGIVIDLLRQGCTDYLDKPLDPKEVLERVAATLQRAAEEEQKHTTEMADLSEDKQVLERELASYRASLGDLQQQVSAAVTSFHDLTRVDDNGYWIRMAHVNRPLSNLGGDFLGVQSISDDICDLFVADVSGHDMGASFHAILLKAFFDENCRQGHTGPDFFRLLNSQLLDSGRNTRMVTGLHARFDRVRMQVQWTCAGHPLPLRLRPQLPIPSPVLMQGDVLGLRPDAVFGQRMMNLQSGQRFVLLTDGITNASRSNGRTGAKYRLSADGLDDVVGHYHARDLRDMVHCVWADVMDYCRQKQTDDMLLVGIEIP